MGRLRGHGSVGGAAMSGGRAGGAALRRPLFSGRPALLGFGLVAPVLAYLAVLFAFPLARILWLSVADPHPTVGHYVRLFTTPLYFQVMLITFRIAAVVTVTCLLVGYPVAYLLWGTGPALRKLLLAVVLLPFWTSLLVRTYAWMVLLQREGLINQLLEALGVIAEPLRLVHNSIGVTVGMTHVLLPFMILPLYSVMNGIDPNLLKAAQSLGAGPLQSFARIFLPLSLPGVGAGCMLVFISAIGFFVTPALLGGPRDTMIAQLIAIQASQLLDWGFASALAVVLLGVTVGLFLFANRALGLGRIIAG